MVNWFPKGRAFAEFAPSKGAIDSIKTLPPPFINARRSDWREGSPMFWLTKPIQIPEYPLKLTVEKLDSLTTVELSPKEASCDCISPEESPTTRMFPASTCITPPSSTAKAATTGKNRFMIVSFDNGRIGAIGQLPM